MIGDRELYEQTKRVLRNLAIDIGLASEDQPAFIMACHDCGLPFKSSIEMGMVEDHAKVHNSEKVKLDLIWIGEGPPPVP